MEHKDFLDIAFTEVIKHPVPQKIINSLKYNYSISFENTRFTWYSPYGIPPLMSTFHENIDYLALTREGAILRTYVLSSSMHSAEDFVKASLATIIKWHQELMPDYKICEETLKLSSGKDNFGFSVEGFGADRQDGKNLCYDRLISFGENVLMLEALIPEKAPRETFWEAKQIINSAEFINTEKINIDEYTSLYGLDEDRSLLVFGYIDKLFEITEDAANCFFEKMGVENNKDNHLGVFCIILTTFIYLTKMFAKDKMSGGLPQFETFVFLHLTKRNISTADNSNYFLKLYPDVEQDFEKKANNSSGNITQSILLDVGWRLAKQGFYVNTVNEHKEALLTLVINYWENKVIDLSRAFNNYIENIQKYDNKKG